MAAPLFLLLTALVSTLSGCSQPFVEPDSGDTATNDTAPDTSALDSDSAPHDTAPPDTLPLCINEFMPSNVSSAFDSAGLAGDWVELHNPTNEPWELDGWSISDDPAEPTKHPLDALSLGRGEFLLLWADGDVSAGADHLPFGLAEGGGDLVLRGPDGTASDVHYGSVEPDFAVARATDCCAGDSCLGFQYRGTPGYSNEPIVFETVPLVNAASTWKYWASDSVDLAWTTPTFDDSAWLFGAAPLGYGDSQATLIPYGDDPENKWMTSWYRLAFDASGTDTMDSMTIGLMRDDGAAVYVNGIEVLRDNVPEGELISTTPASAATLSETGFYTFTLDAFPLVDGTNVVAVEVHQYTANSSDVTMDLVLSASRVVE